MINLRLLSLVFTLLLLCGCAVPPSNEYQRNGLQFGSAIERNIFIDASQFKNRKVKVTTRNTSGDPAYELSQFTANLNDSLARKGYLPTTADSFGMRLDVNVIYSGAIQRNMSATYSFLGGSAGAIAGYRSDHRGATATGALTGATIGAIIGSGIVDTTYIVVAEVSIGVNDVDATDKTVITFGSSPPLQQETARNFSPFREVLRTKIAVYAGGRNVAQQQIAGEVQRRLISIVSDTI